MVQGKDLKQYKHQIELNGEKIKLSFDMNALQLLEEHWGSMEDAFRMALSGSIEGVKSLVWAGINAGFENEADYLTMKEVGSLIGVGQVSYILNTVPSLFLNSIPDEKEVTTKKNPRKR